MVDAYKSLEDYWKEVPRAMRFFRDGSAVQVSAAEAMAWNAFSVIWEECDNYRPDWHRLQAIGEGLKGTYAGPLPTLTMYDVLAMSEPHRDALFENGVVAKVELVGNDYLRVDWVKRGNGTCRRETHDRVDVCYLDAGTSIGVACAFLSTSGPLEATIVVNTSTAAGEWIHLMMEREADMRGQLNVVQSAIPRLRKHWANAARSWTAINDLVTFVGRLARILPTDLSPPEPFPSKAEDFGVLTPSRLESIRKEQEMQRRLKAYSEWGYPLDSADSRHWPGSERKTRYQPPRPPRSP
jgi:hypothetical protein